MYAAGHPAGPIAGLLYRPQDQNDVTGFFDSRFATYDLYNDLANAADAVVPAPVLARNILTGVFYPNLNNLPAGSDYELYFASRQRHSYFFKI